MAAIIQGNGIRKSLGANALTIGKKSDNDLRIKEAADHHAEIRLYKTTYRTSSGGQGDSKNRYGIVDLGSQSGTFVNGRKLASRKEQYLKDGDKIRIGSTTLTYKGSSSEASGAGGFVLFLLVVFGIIGFALYQSSSTPEKTLSSYCDALNAKDYQTAYNQLASSIQNHETEKQFASALQQDFTKQGGLKACNISPVQEHGSTATSTLTYSFANGKTSANTDTLINENNTWKIDSAKP